MPDKPTKTQLVVDALYGVDETTMDDVEEATGLERPKMESIILKLKREGMLELRGNSVRPNAARLQQKYVRKATPSPR